MRKTLLIFIPFLIIAVFFSACKKKDNATPPPNATISKFTGCRIAQISEIGSGESVATIYTFTYNNDGTVATISFQAAGGRKCV